MRDSASMAVLYAVIGICALVTAGIAYYSRVLLPRRIEQRIRESVSAFGTAIELRFPNHCGLSDRVVMLSLAIGRRLNMSPKELRTLELACRLRDIGLCAIPYALVNKKSPLEWDAADRETYHRHAEVSGAMLELVPYLSHVAQLVRSHHLDFDGGPENPFPSRLDIPIHSRIMHAVSDFVWYSRLEGSLLARDRMKRGAGQKYDPRVVECLLQVLTSSRVESAAPVYAQV
jgi:response regulator RpfG family c-di-GMP phosphodiesterase